MDYFNNRLFELQDIEYKEFHKKLIPGTDQDRIIGVRTPELRALAKKLFKENNINEFMKNLPHYYYEENNLHAFFIEQIKDYDKCIYELNKFLPYVDNWATCDLMRPKCFDKNTDKLLNEIDKWLLSGEVYTVRFGVETLMTFYLDERFDESYLRTVSEIKSDEYYINMMIAWYFATALAKQYNSAIKYIENKSLSDWVHNKTIQKAIESRRISDARKEYLRSLKV